MNMEIRLIKSLEVKDLNGALLTEMKDLGVGCPERNETISKKVITSFLINLDR